MLCERDSADGLSAVCRCDNGDCEYEKDSLCEDCLYVDDGVCDKDDCVCVKDCVFDDCLYVDDGVCVKDDCVCVKGDFEYDEDCICED